MEPLNRQDWSFFKPENCSRFAEKTKTHTHQKIPTLPSKYKRSSTCIFNKCSLSDHCGSCNSHNSTANLQALVSVRGRRRALFRAVLQFKVDSSGNLLPPELLDSSSPGNSTPSKPVWCSGYSFRLGSGRPRFESLLWCERSLADLGLHTHSQLKMEKREIV